MKCTVCTAYCPVLQVNPLYPGPKQAGPDGERLRLKDPYFFNYALKYCLNCKRCEVACPSGVKVADLIQSARIKYDTHPPKLRDQMLASTDFMGKLARPFAPIVNAVTDLGVTKKTLDMVLDIDHRRTFPKYSGRSFEGWLKRRSKEHPEQVAYFHGCYVNYNYPQLGKDLVKVLNALGVGVQLLDKEQCCGIAMIANGMAREAANHARHNVGVLEKAVSQGLKVVTTSSTCTLTMRDEYPELLKVNNAAVRDSLLMATRFIYEKLEKGAVLNFKTDYHKKIAYHTPCHSRCGVHHAGLQLLRHVGNVWLQKGELRSLPGHWSPTVRTNQGGESGRGRLRLRNLQMADRNVHRLSRHEPHFHPRRSFERLITERTKLFRSPLRGRKSFRLRRPTK